VVETFTRVAVDSNVGQVVLNIWSPLLFVLSVRSTWKNRRIPAALPFYTVAVAGLMMAPVPREVWINSYFIFIAAASLILYVFESRKAEGWKRKLAETGSRLTPLSPMLFGLFFVTSHDGASQIEDLGVQLRCSASPKNLAVMAGRAETARQSYGLDLTSYWDSEPGSLEIRYSDTFRDSRGHYVKGAQVAGYVEKWVTNHGGANNVKFRRFKPTVFTAPKAQ
jgi:hypothetical protein